jgi:hypothetical protein
VEVGRASKIGNVLSEGKRTIKGDTKVSNAGREVEVGKSLRE